MQVIAVVVNVAVLIVCKITVYTTVEVLQALRRYNINKPCETVMMQCIVYTAESRQPASCVSNELPHDTYVHFGSAVAP